MSKYLVILHDAQDNSQIGREELKLRLCESLNVSQPAVERLMESLPVILRRDLEKDVAENYASKLERLGAVVEAIEQVDGITQEILAGAALPDSSSDAADGKTRRVSPPMPGDDSGLSLGFDEDSQAEISALENLLDAALGDEETVEDSSRSPEKRNGASPSASAKSVELSFSIDESAAPPVPSRASILAELMGEPTPASAPPTKAESKPAPPPPPIEKSPPPPSGETVPRAAISSAFSKSTAPDAEPVLEVVPLNKPKNKRRFAQLALFGVAAVAFFFALPSIFSALGLRRVPGMSVSIDVDTLLREQSAILGLDAPKETRHTAVITGQWVGELEENGVGARLRLTEMDNVLSLASLEVNTPQPPKLTNEELAAGKPLPVWLRKLEASNLRRMQASATPGAALSFVGNGRAYLEDAKGSERILVEVEVNLTAPGAETQEIKAGWRLRRSADDESGETPNEVSRLAGKDFRVFFRGKARAAREAPKAKAEPKDPQDKTKK